MTFTGKFVYIAHHFILLRLNLFYLTVDRERWWFEHSLPQLLVCFSAEGAKNVSWFWLSPLGGWGSPTMKFTGKFVYMAHHFILLRLNLFYLTVDRERWWFEHSLPQLLVCFSAEGAKNVSWFWLSPLGGWGSPTMKFTGKFAYMAHHFILLRLNLFYVTVDRGRWWFGHSVSQLLVCLSAEGAKNFSGPWLSLL